MKTYQVKTYRPMSRLDGYRARIHGAVPPYLEGWHIVHAASPLEALLQFPAYINTDFTSRSSFEHDAHSQHNPRVGTVGAVATEVIQ